MIDRLIVGALAAGTILAMMPLSFPPRAPTVAAQRAQALVPMVPVLVEQKYTVAAPTPVPLPQPKPQLAASAGPTSMVSTPMASLDAALPPLQYDRPYRGALVVERYNTLEEVRQRCAQFGPIAPGALACSWHRNASNCYVILPSDAIMRTTVYPAEIIWRHEIGHCNEWPNDHPGVRLNSSPPGEAPTVVGATTPAARPWF